MMDDNTADQSGDLVARWSRGDQEAASQLFQRYSNRLIVLARSHLPNKLSQRIDPEDVVQSVYRSFFVRVRDGQYDLKHGGDLWRLMVTITLNKLANEVKRNSRDKRAVEREHHFGSADQLLGIHASMLAREPSPVEAVALTEQVDQLMRRLQPMQRSMLQLRLQGYTLNEIAAELGCSERTVIRVLQGIKQQLEQWSVDGEGGCR